MEAGLLAQFQQQQLAAREVRERQERERDLSAKRAKEAEAIAEREKAHAEATRMLRLSAASHRSSLHAALGPRGRGAGSSSRACSVASPKKRNSASGGGGRKGAQSGRIEKKTKKKRDAKPRIDPTKPLPGMEFVERRHKPKQVVVPNTMDYSDVFPEQFENCDVEALRKTFEATAAAAEYNKKIAEERKQNYQRFLKNAALDKKDNGRRVSDSNWVAVSAPAAIAAATSRTKSRGGTSLGESSLSPAKPQTKKAIKDDEQRRKAAETASKLAALRESIMRATGGAPFAGKKLAQSSNMPKGASAHPRTSEKRLRAESDEDEDNRRRKTSKFESSRYSQESRQTMQRHQSPEHESDGYDDFDEDDEDDDDDESDFGTGFEDVMAEEAKSAEHGALEDKREMRRLAKAKKEKERRRREWERKYGR